MVQVHPLDPPGDNIKHHASTKVAIKFRRVASRARASPRLLSVEPIVFVVYLAWVFGNTFQAPAVYRRICQIYYGGDASVDCYSISNATVENTVQRHTAEWTLYSAIAYLIPAIFADTILGAYGDRYGRKLNILFGLTGLVLSEFGYLLTLSSAATPFWTTLLFSALGGSTGYIAMIPVSCNAYLADTTEDAAVLTLRSALFAGLQILGSATGSFVAAGLASSISVPVAIDIEQFLLFTAFLFTMWRIPQKPGLLEIDRRSQVSPSASASSMPRRPSLPTRVRMFLRELFDLLLSGFNTYKKSRQGHKRSFMLVTVAVLMLSFTTSAETRTSGIINSYVFRRVSSNSLGWGTSDLGYWNGSGYMLLLFGTVAGTFFFKRVLHLRETTLLLIGLTSSSLRSLLIGLSAADWTMHLANVAGMFAGLIQPAAVSFIAQLVSSTEVGRAFSLLGIATDCSFVVTILIYTNIYRATVPWCPSFVFFLMCFLQFIAVLSMMWVHVTSIKEGIGSATSQQRPASVQHAISRIGEATEPEIGIQKNISKGNIGKRQISIIDYAENLANRDTQLAIWESMEDVRRSNPNSNGAHVTFY